MTLPRMHDVSELTGSRVVAVDGEVGRLQTLQFDDTREDVRYLVVDIDSGLGGHSVLVSPRAVWFVDASAQIVFLNLTLAQTIRCTLEPATGSR